MSDEEMLQTFHCGVGFNVVAAQKDKGVVVQHMNRFYDCYEVGIIETGECKVEFKNRINWL